jgi:hypothetical protein
MLIIANDVKNYESITYIINNMNIMNIYDTLTEGIVKNLYTNILLINKIKQLLSIRVIKAVETKTFHLNLLCFNCLNKVNR